MAARAKAVLDRAYNYLGLAEYPKGSNLFKGHVNPFTHGHAWQWCAGFVSTIYHDVSGEYPVKTFEVSTHRMWNRADALDIAHRANDPTYTPRIGVIFFIDHGGGKGHVGLVTGFKRDLAGKIIGVYIIAGNQGDAVREGYNSLSKIYGFIDPYDADDTLATYAHITQAAPDALPDLTDAKTT